MLQRVHGRLGNKERSLPQPEHLRQAMTMIGMFVGNQDAVERLNGDIQRGETSQRFPFAKTRVH